MALSRKKLFEKIEHYYTLVKSDLLEETDKVVMLTRLKDFLAQYATEKKQLEEQITVATTTQESLKKQINEVTAKLNELKETLRAIVQQSQASEVKQKEATEQLHLFYDLSEMQYEVDKILNSLTNTSVATMASSQPIQNLAPATSNLAQATELTSSTGLASNAKLPSSSTSVSAPLSTSSPSIVPPAANSSSSVSHSPSPVQPHIALQDSLEALHDRLFSPFITELDVTQISQEMLALLKRYHDNGLRSVGSETNALVFKMMTGALKNVFTQKYLNKTMIEITKLHGMKPLSWVSCLINHMAEAKNAKDFKVFLQSKLTNVDATLHFCNSVSNKIIFTKNKSNEHIKPSEFSKYYIKPMRDYLKENKFPDSILENCNSVHSFYKEILEITKDKKRKRLDPKVQCASKRPRSTTTTNATSSMTIQISDATAESDVTAALLAIKAASQHSSSPVALSSSITLSSFVASSSSVTYAASPSSSTDVTADDVSLCDAPQPISPPTRKRSPGLLFSTDGNYSHVAPYVASSSSSSYTTATRSTSPLLINPTDLNWSEKFTKKFQAKTVENVLYVPIQINGTNAFAQSIIQEGDVISDYELNKCDDKGPTGGIARFFEPSLTPNCGFFKSGNKGFIAAIADIAEGEKITLKR